MSTQPIIIQIDDKIDPQIAIKIRDIGTQARAAAVDVRTLQGALGGLSATGSTLTTQFSTLGKAVNSVTPPIRSAQSASNALEGGFARLASRAAAAELGVGRLGGAFAQVGIAAAGAGPVIVAALVVGAIVGAILVYDKMYAASRKLVEAQTDLEDHFASQHDKLLTLQEAYAGLVDGPLARYNLALANFNKRSVVVDITEITKTLNAQKSTWADLISVVERYSQAISAFAQTSFSQAKQQGNFNIPGAEKFIQDQKLAIAVANDAGKGYEALQKSLADVGQELNKWHDIEKQEPEAVRAITEVGRKAIQNFYLEEKNDLNIHNQELKTLRAEAAGETISEMKKAAAAQLKEWNDELERYKAAQGKITAQQELSIRQAQEAGAPRPSLIGPSQPALPFNVTKIQGLENKDLLAIQNQGPELDKIIGKYTLAAEKAGAYDNELKASVEVTGMIAEATNKMIPITDDLIDRFTKSATANVANAEAGRAAVAMYNQLAEPLNKYNLTLAASTKLLADHKITQDQATAANVAAARTYKDFVDPLNEANISLDQQTKLLGLFGNELKVTTEIEGIRQDLQKRGIPVDEASLQALRARMLLMEQEKQVQSAETQLWEQTAGAQEKLTVQLAAVNKAYKDNILTQGQARASIFDLYLAQNQLNNALTGGTLKSNVIQIYGSLLTDFKSMGSIGAQTAQALTKDFSQFFATLDKGITDGIAHWAVYGGSLKQALADTGRQAVASLISSLLQLGIELVIIDALSHVPGLKKLFDMMDAAKNDTGKKQLEQAGEAIGAIIAVTAVQLAAIKLLEEPAWSLAEAVSLFSFGANAIPAAAGITAVIAAGSAGKGAAGLYAGGIVTGSGFPGGIDTVPTWLTKGEFVVNDRATANNRALLESINSGASAVRSNGSALTAPNGQMKVSVTHDGSTSIAVQQISPDEVRIIAKQEARQAVQQHAPGVIASDLYNPNSQTSKAMVRNVGPRKRT